MKDNFDETLTQAEKDAPTFLEWSDETLARSVRHGAHLIGDENGNKALFFQAGAIAMGAMMMEANAENMSTELDVDRGGEDWELVVKASLKRKAKP